MSRSKEPKDEMNVIKLDKRMQIEAIAQQLSDITEEFIRKRQKLKELKRAKFEAEKKSEAKKAEEEEARVLEAIKESGLTVEEFIELLKE